MTSQLPELTPDPAPMIADHREEVVRRPATAARAEFFELLENVVANPNLVVLIEHRHLPQRGVLVGEAYLEYVRQLERLVRDLLVARAPADSFTLCGTATLNEDLERAIAAMRAGEAAAADGR